MNTPKQAYSAFFNPNFSKLNEIYFQLIVYNTFPEGDKLNRISFPNSLVFIVPLSLARIALDIAMFMCIKDTI